MENTTHLLLQEQLCFPVYAASRMITRLYTPWLDKLNLTYPQYLVMLVLWEENNVNIKRLGERLYLNSNTLTPLVKKLQEKELVKKSRSSQDERSVQLELTNKGKQLKEQALEIPAKLMESSGLTMEEMRSMRELMNKFLTKADQ